MNPVEEVIGLINKAAKRADECFNGINRDVAYFGFMIRLRTMPVIFPSPKLKVIEFISSFDGNPLWPSVDENMSVLLRECKTLHTCEYGVCLVFESFYSYDNLVNAILEDPDVAIFAAFLQGVEQALGLPEYKMGKVPKKGSG